MIERRSFDLEGEGLESGLKRKKKLLWVITKVYDCGDYMGLYKMSKHQVIALNTCNFLCKIYICKNIKLFNKKIF